MILSNTPIWLYLLLILPLLLPIIKLIQNSKSRKKLPPSPPKLPIIGNLLQLGKLSHQSLWQLSKKYGPVMLLRLGNVQTLIVSSAEAAKDILKTHDAECCSRPALLGTGRFSYNYLDVGFSPYGEYWREIRKICVLELFSSKRVQSFRYIREEEVALLIQSIPESSCSPSHAVNLTEKMMTLSTSVILRVAFGESFRGSGIDNDRFQELVREAEAMIGSFSASDFFPYVGWIIDRLTGLHARMEKSFHDWDLFYQKVLDDHLDPERMKQEGEDIVDVMLKIERENTETKQFTTDHIKAVLMDIFLAGIDTSSITVVWSMAELARNPRAMRKVQDEVRNCAGKKGMITENDIDKLEYLKMVVKETLRLHPAAALLLPRETMSHFKINGYDIDPKTRVHVNVWAIGRDPDIWDNPEVFFPERFVDTAVDYKGQDFSLLPFGAGRRGCPGMQMGLAMVELSLANLLYSFDWKLPLGMKEEDISMEEEAGVAVYKKFPLELVAIKHEFPRDM